MDKKDLMGEYRDIYLYTPLQVGLQCADDVRIGDVWATGSVALTVTEILHLHRSDKDTRGGLHIRALEDNDTFNSVLWFGDHQRLVYRPGFTLSLCAVCEDSEMTEGAYYLCSKCRDFCERGK